ncbi:MAG: FAD-binding oxidoreductase [Deltaproteobacteria bacterium]|nr:FAD-binding oxidoreductase [Deltaproteobacteria bacterium]
MVDGYVGEEGSAGGMRPSCVVRPGSSDEVQRIVHWANETRTPLVPVSSGLPQTHGGTAPRVDGAVLLDLTRMKRVLRTDARNRVVWVEAGVTYAELQPELERAGLAAYLPLCPRGSKSVLASVLEREPTTMPAHHWDATDPLLCAEVVFGSGDRMRTGEAAGPGSLEEQWEIGKAHMTTYGHSQMDENKLLSGAQGTMGVVTWASLKCRQATQFSRTLLVPSQSLEPLLRLSREAARVRLPDHCFLVNALNLAALLAREPKEIAALRDRLPPWILVASFEGYGELPEQKVAWQEADFREMAVRAGCEPVEALFGARGDELGAILSGPSAEPHWKAAYKGGCRDVFFLTTLDKTPGFIEAVSALSGSRQVPWTDVGVYLQPVVQGTSCHCEFDLYFDPAKDAENEQVRRLAEDCAETLSRKGAFFSRPYGPWAKLAYGHRGDATDLLRKVKSVFDPNQILNPGQLCF